jgi:molybdate transport system substrate-binding protein
VRRAAVLAASAAAVAGCGGQGGERGELVVSAASSLGAPLRACTARSHPGPRVRLQLAGSDELAAQIRQGVRPDVYAAASTVLPERLAAEGLVEPPVAFATNRLVVAVRGGAPVDAVDDLTADGVKIALGSEGVPIGDYAREAIARLGAERGRRILANVRSEEPDAKGVVGKLAQGAADAGFVYRTDARAARLRTIPLPERLEPDVAYGAAVVKGTDRREEARAFVEGLHSAQCADALRDAGFGRAPR